MHLRISIGESFCPTVCLFIDPNIGQLVGQSVAFSVNVLIAKETPVFESWDTVFLFSPYVFFSDVSAYLY